jgi:hypothetical protein
MGIGSARIIEANDNSPIQVVAVSQQRLAYFQQLFEATILLLIVFVLAVMVAVAPESMWALHSRGRIVLLSAVCTWWVLSWLAMWKLCARDPADSEQKLVACLWTIRILATMYLSVPYLGWVLGTHIHAPDVVVLAIGLSCVLGGLISGLSCFVFLAGRARKMNRHLLAFQCFVCGIFTTLACVAIMLPKFDNDISSLGTMLRLPPAIMPIQPAAFGLMVWTIAIVWQFAEAVQRSDAYSVPRPTSVPLVSS